MSAGPAHEYGLPQQMMTLSAIAYAGENDRSDDVAAKISAGLANEAYATRGLWSLAWGPAEKDETLFYLAEDSTAPGRYALAIRGTDFVDPANWLEDFWIGLTHYPLPEGLALDPAPKITKGTSEGLAFLISLYEGGGLRDFLVSAAEAAGGLELLVTGHSLGGCLASALAVWLADDLSGVGARVHAYTFAAPTAGDAAFAAYADSRLAGASFRYFNELDVVPRSWNDVASMKTTPTTIGLLDEWVVPIIDALVLESRRKNFAHPGEAFPLSGGSTVEGGWLHLVGREHASATYLVLLNAPPIG